MSRKHYEDIIMKSVHEYFGKAILPFLGIYEEIVAVGPTEIPVLVMTQMYMDFTFLTVSGRYLHFEFQTTDGGVHDLQRFHSYEAWLHYNTGREVITYVIFTGDIVDPVYEEAYGINTYRTIPISMKNKDADSFLAYLSDKKRRNEPMTDMDFAGLAMTPVMGSTKSKVQRIYEAASLICEDTSEAAHRVMAVLYAFAEKFMNDPMDLERLREVMRMTRLGQMLFDEGLEQGREQGLKEGREQGLEEGREQGLEEGREQGLEEGREQGLKEGRKQGLEEGRELGVSQSRELITKLLNDDRIDDLRKLATDWDYQNKLMKEYHL